MGSGILVVLAIAVASNLDNAGVGIAYGVRGVQISPLANTLIALISGLATWLSGVAGQIIVHYVSGRTASIIGGVVVVLVGLWVMTEPLRDRVRKRSAAQGGLLGRILRDPTVADFDASKTISLSEASVLGVALSLNALAGGFDAGMAHIGVWQTACGVGIFSYVLLGLCAYAGRRFAAERLGSRATVLAGVLLILVGLHQFL
ncbi:MAG: manganese efflux pump [Alicyclobacillus sp.]|nr:manganese efflux pump [Alicyclobacillus sp.]